MRILLILLFIILIYWAQSSIYISNCFNKVSTNIKFKHDGIFVGEKTKLITVFANKKLMPLWWIGVKFNLSRNIVFEEEKNENQGNDNFRKDNFFIASYEKITKEYSIQAARRGYYVINEVELSSSDLLGKYRVLKNYQCNAELYVYPALIDKNDLYIKLNKMNGEILTKRHIIEDPFQLRGIRQYELYDSLKVVNWNATAKTGELKVNQFDYTVFGEVTIFLNIEKYNNWDSEAILEESISLASSLATEYLKIGMPVEIITNGCDIISGEQIQTLSGSNLVHNINIYESLARIDLNKTVNSIQNIMQEQLNEIKKRKIIYLISYFSDKSLREQFNISRLEGFDIRWIMPINKNAKAEIEDMEQVFIWEVNDK
jgi:Uncharacterized conserved protein (some members contain a von Willebrand factor type A (vWA) domain)